MNRYHFVITWYHLKIKRYCWYHLEMNRHHFGIKWYILKINRFHWYHLKMNRYHLMIMWYQLKINRYHWYHLLLNDREFWLILLIRDWPRRGLLDRTSDWVHRKCLTTVYSGSLWCHNENAGFRVKFLLRLASLMCIFLWRHNIRTSFRADFCLRLTTPLAFLCD